MKIKFTLLIFFFFLGGKLLAQTDSTHFRLDDCITYALANSPFLKANQKNIMLSEKDVDISRSNFFPKLELSANTQFTDMYEKQNEYNNSYMAIDFVQPIWQNGKARIQTQIAKTNKEISKNEFQLQRQNIAYAVSLQYLTTVKFERLYSLSEAMKIRVKIYLDYAQERLKLGVAKKSDVLWAETNLSEAELISIQYETQNQISFEQLKKLMGYFNAEKFQLFDNPQSINFNYLATASDSFISMAFKQLPELEIYKNRQNTQKQRIELEKRQNRPDFNAFAGYNWNNSPVLNKDLYAYVGISLNFKLFDGFAKRNRIAKASIKKEQIELETLDLKSLIESEIRQAYLLLKEAKSRIDNSTKQLESAEKTLEMVNEEYKNGLSSMLELLDAENEFFIAQQNHIEATFAYKMAEITLKRKSGKFAFSI